LPLVLKIFFGLCLALTGVWLFRDYQLYTVVPVPLPEEVKTHFLITGLVCALVVSLAWMTAFRRQNWARWTLAGLFAGGRLVPLVLIAARGELLFYVRDMTADPPTNPLWYAVLLFEVAAIVLVLGPWAEAWFKKSARA
jgi:hypothetical protein